MCINIYTYIHTYKIRGPLPGNWTLLKVSKSTTFSAIMHGVGEKCA